MCRRKMPRDILKLSGAFLLGFLTSYLINSTVPCPGGGDLADLESKQEPEIKLCQNERNSVQLREAYTPSTLFDVIRYEYFTDRHIYGEFDSDPRIGFLGHHKGDLTHILEQLSSLYHGAKGYDWFLKKIIDGYRRFDPNRGEEYVLNVELRNTHDQSKKDVQRFEVVKPFSTAHLLNIKPYQSSETVHFILPISKVTNRLRTFLKSFEETFLKPKEEVHLLLVVMEFNFQAKEGDGVIVRNLVKDLRIRYPQHKVTMLQTKRPFSRALGIDLGTKQLPEEALMFFCDVDVTLKRDFLDRCRSTAVHGRQVYYPIVFSQYDPELAKGYSPVTKVKDLLDINKYTGHWITYGFGMVCLHQADYRRVGGFDLSITGWGGEDVDLYLKHVKSDLKVFRAMDPSLIHVYHSRSCDPNLTKEQLRMCIDSMAEGYGSKTQLAKMVLRNKMMPQNDE
ncbi:chondroitin sulfate synthase 1 [Lingula anatina]|uniref:Hexosyltransferase n=1 Tax=Lingula anatina TaxID=7574 RepID=A0A1S3KFI6_LINAN|nr:chondroitin sulfate synthase 1 [Lingula anatina]XP_013421399.1 chondroitin sulfate synthase 1 [Lingula anatina]|eukprot:XP_013421398.1 chondroitin sulfate synthase 1 [Lingula anatina]